jgi:hypothetical protein
MDERASCLAGFDRRSDAGAAAVVLVVCGPGEDSFRWRPNLSRAANPLRPSFPRSEGFRVEFRLGTDGGVDELLFHQPNGTSVARRA